jgi:hypothetical protein
LSVDRSAGDAFAPVLSRLEADLAAHFGDGPFRLVPAGGEERPFSHLQRLAVWRRDGNAPISHLFVKIFKPAKIDGGLEAMRRRVADDFQTTRRVHTSMLAHPALGAVRPIACYPDHLAIVTEEIAGPTLLDVLVSSAAWFPDASRVEQLNATMANVGRWIRAYQSIEPAGEVETIAGLRAYVDHRLTRLVEHPGARFGQPDREQVLDHIDRLGEQVDVSELRLVPIHADLAPANILVSDGRIVVLDFAMAKHGTWVHDLTRLVLQVELLSVKPQIRNRVLHGARLALIQGFDGALTDQRPLFRLMLLLHRVNHLTTLSVKPSRGAAALYNRFVRRQHRRWIAAEIARGTTAAARA